MIICIVVHIVKSLSIVDFALRAGKPQKALENEQRRLEILNTAHDRVPNAPIELCSIPLGNDDPRARIHFPGESFLYHLNRLWHIGKDRQFIRFHRQNTYALEFVNRFLQQHPFEFFLRQMKMIKREKTGASNSLISSTFILHKHYYNPATDYGVERIRTAHRTDHAQYRRTFITRIIHIYNPFDSPERAEANFRKFFITLYSKDSKLAMDLAHTILETIQRVSEERGPNAALKIQKSYDNRRRILQDLLRQWST